jgi:hypothetical protein
MYIYDLTKVYKMKPHPTGQSVKDYTTYDRSNSICIGLRKEAP